MEGNFGIIEFKNFNNRPKLICKLNQKVKYEVTPFNGDNYIHITARGKTTSLSLREMQEISSNVPLIQEKLYLLDVEPSEVPQGAVSVPVPQVPQGAVNAPVPQVPQGAVNAPVPQVPQGAVNAPVPQVPQGAVNAPVPQVPQGAVNAPVPQVPRGAARYHPYNRSIEEDYS